MATCDLWMKTHQNFNEVLSTTTNLSEEYERNCKKTWKEYELELAIIEKELESYGESLKSYDLKCRLDFALLEIEIHKDFEKWRRKSRQDLEDAINRTGKYAKYAFNPKIVETSEVQCKSTCIENENNIHQDINNTCNDELCCTSIFIVF